jgi:hypothetical protein
LHILGITKERSGEVEGGRTETKSKGASDPSARGNHQEQLGYTSEAVVAVEGVQAEGGAVQQNSGGDQGQLPNTEAAHEHQEGEDQANEVTFIHS